MKLRTSFFNPTVLKKDITRFAPLWGLYTVFMLLFLFLLWGDSTTGDHFAREANCIMLGMGVVNFFYAGLACLLLFGDLFQSRLCNALHALPLRREGWFLTHLSAGLLFCLIPNALGAVVAAVMLGQFAYLAYVWLGLMLLQYICFFGIAAFSVQCAGSILGAATVYGIVNFLSVLVLWMVKCFYEPVLFGITINGETLAQLSPAVGFSSKSYVDVDFVYNADTTAFKGFVAEGWLYALLAALTGIAFLAAALFMYRRRKLESAGDFIAFRPAAPAFLILYSLCVGALLYTMGDSVDTAMGNVCLMIGLGVGWFTGLMLLKKRVNIFRGKAFAGFGVLIFAFYLSITVVWLDPFGTTRYVPQADQVKAVSVSPYASEYYYNQHASMVTEPADIERLTQIHQNLITTRDDNASHPIFRIRYTLKTGVEVERTYHLDAESTDGQWVKNIYSSTETVLGGSNLDRLKQTVRFAEIYFYNDDYFPETANGTIELKAEHWDGLLDALAADCAAGNMAQIWDYHKDDAHVASLSIQVGNNSYKELMVYQSCTNTLAYLQALPVTPQTPE